MPKKRKISPAEKLARTIVLGMQEKKAQDIVILDMRQARNAVADYFVICSGSSDKQLAAISDSVVEEVEKHLGEKPWHREGRQNKEWMLMDYINVVAHILRKDKREHYALEKLWGDADIERIENAL